MAMLYILITAACLLVGLYFLFQLKGPKRCNLPGPIGVPYLGVLPFMKEAHIYFTETAKKYGDIFCCKIERADVVVLNSFEVIDDFFRKKADLYQDKYCYIPDHVDIPIGYAEAQYGPRMVELRDFSLKALSDRNAGKGTYDDLVNYEVSEFCKYISEEFGTKPVETFDTNRRCLSNVLMTFLIQKRFKYGTGDPEVEELFQDVNNIALSMHPAFFFKHPWEMKLRQKFNLYPSDMEARNADGKRKILQRCKDEVDVFLARVAEGKERGYCFLDRYWNGINEKKALGEKTFLTKNSMKGMLFNLLGAGMHSTAMFASWAQKICVKLTDVQDKLREEIFSTLGRDKLPKLQDRKDFPYMNAFLQECERFISLVPLGIPHTSARDSTYNGYFIPKGIFIFSNLYAVHYNEELFPKPAEFRPERFIDDEGKFVRSKYVNLFGIGKRACPGQLFVQREMFLFMVQLLQKFELKPPAGVSKEDLVLKGKTDGNGIYSPNFKIRYFPLPPENGKA